MILSGKIVTRAIRIVSVALVIISFLSANFQGSSDDGLLDVLFGFLFIIFPAVPLLFLSVKVFEKLPRTTAIIAVVETAIVLDLFYGLNFGSHGSSTSAVAVFFIPFYLLIPNVLTALVIAVCKK